LRAARQPAFAGSSITTRGGDAKVHGRMLPVAPIELAEFFLSASQADLQVFDLADTPAKRGYETRRGRSERESPRTTVRTRRRQTAPAEDLETGEVSIRWSRIFLADHAVLLDHH
jgi:hypothetical protein